MLVTFRGAEFVVAAGLTLVHLKAWPGTFWLFVPS